nr:uncharacterized protein LOC109155085 [Ipomoea batatas]GMD46978.1 uncharacterized protein LOC109155085 [Ipomoea batatas]
MRNSIIWNNQTLDSAEATVRSARTYYKDWTNVVTEDHVEVKKDITDVKWTKPQEGFLKLNVDAAIDKHTGNMGFGCVLRNNHGSFVAACGLRWRGIYNAKEAEAIAIRESLSWLKSNNFDNINVETDSLLVVQGLKSTLGDSSFHLILADMTKG